MPKGDFFRNMSPEQKAEFYGKLAESRRQAHKTKTRIEPMPIHPHTDQMWMEIARQHGGYLPKPTTPLTTGGLIAGLRKFGIPYATWQEWTALPIKTFVEYNPRLSLRAAVGFAIEHLLS